MNPESLNTYFNWRCKKWL